MSGWIFDEDITKDAVDGFIKHGINGLHIKGDLNLGGSEDSSVFQVAKKKKKTLITANTKHFLGISNQKLHKSSGVWMLETDDPGQQVKLVIKALKVTKLDTLQLRAEKKVKISSKSVVVIDGRTNEKTTFLMDGK